MDVYLLTHSHMDLFSQHANHFTDNVEKKHFITGILQITITIDKNIDWLHRFY